MAKEEQIQGTASRRERYTSLAPMDVDTETAVAKLASTFFSPMFQLQIRRPPAGQPLTPASGRDFIDFLTKSNTLSDEPSKYISQIRELLERMSSNGLLVDMGVGPDGAFVVLPKCYYAISEVSKLRQRGVLWLAKILGGRFVHRHVSPAIVHIVGKNDKGEGSGIVFDARHVLTCRHVVARMDVATEQVFQGKLVTIEQVVEHDTQDVAVVRVKERLATVPGLGFLAPTVSQKVYRFGYSRVPCSIPSSTGISPLVMQSGEVSSESVSVFGGTELFLYSAIARPGDSGGAVVSDDGYVVGMTTELSDARQGTSDDPSDGDAVGTTTELPDSQSSKKEGEDVFSPHYAGIPSHVLAQAVDDLCLGVRVSYETYE